MKLKLVTLAFFLSLIAIGSAYDSWFTNKKKQFDPCEYSKKLPNFAPFQFQPSYTDLRLGHEHNGTLDIEKGKIIQSLTTWGIPFQVSLDITLVDPPKRWTWHNVLQITTSSSSSYNFPTIDYYYHGSWDEIQFFEIRVPSGQNVKFYPIFNKTYHFQITQFFGHEGVKNHIQVDNYVLYSGENKSNGKQQTNLKVFTSNPWRDPFTSDIGKVENLKIFSESDCWGNKVPSSNLTHPDKCKKNHRE